MSVIPIELPPLRERRDDIPLLARAFLERFRTAMEKPLEGISPEAMEMMESYDWPGNVRELENTIERSVALETGTQISITVLPEKISRTRGDLQKVQNPALAAGNLKAEIPAGGIDLEKYIQGLETAYLVAAIEACDGVGTRAAELLKMSYRSFRHYSKKYNIT